MEKILFNKSSKMHVCILTSGRMFEAPFGGEERFTLAFANWIIAHNYDVTLMASRFAGVEVKRWDHASSEQLSKIKFEKTKFRVLNPPYLVYMLSRLVLTFLWAAKIVAVHRKTPIRVLHAQDTGYSGLAAVIAGKLLRIPVIISSHGIRHKTLESVVSGGTRGLVTSFESRIDNFNVKHADAIIGINEQIKEYYKTISRKAVCIPVPINVKDFEFSEGSRAHVRDELGVNPDAILVGYVGRFSPEKNLASLIQAFSEVANDIPTAKLVLVGTGILEDEMRNLVRNLNLADRVLFLGVRYDIGKILSSIDIFVLPSFTEGLSLSLMEAMAAGRAIICSDIDSNKNLVTNRQEALLIDPHSVANIVGAIRSLSADDKIRDQLGRNAKLAVAQYDEERVYPRILDQYSQLTPKHLQ